ncbi:TPA: hypothetical protein GRI67_23885 [Vibrio parahaemolyticus]|nr:hypothetical protein [Vibrio parahaemolyticus]HAS6755996.1 hypothetical protein [Vibrio parahaemolyticus]HAS6775558.1 hypothetical protein [Vibrio parahaemolyticus]
MFEKDLCTALESCLKQGVKRYGGMSGDFFVFSIPHVEKIVSLLKTNPMVVETFDNKAANCGNVRYPINLKSTANNLLLECLEKPIDIVVKNLLNFLASDCSTGVAILAISGIEVGKEIELTSDISIVPFTSLPKSRMTESLDPPYLKLDYHLNRGDLPLHANMATQTIDFGYLAPKAAIIKRVELRPKVYESLDSEHVYIDTSDLKELFDLLTLVKGISSVILGDWFEIDKSVPFFKTHSMSYSIKLPDVFSPNSVLIEELDIESFKLVINSYFDLKYKVRKQLKIPLNRLNISRRKKNNIDRVIDLGIAYESLFLSDNPNKISLTLRKRVSSFFVKTDCGINMFEFMRTFYSCRSDAAHTGEVQNNYSIKGADAVISVESLLDIADTVISKSIIKIIQERKGVSWW